MRNKYIGDDIRSRLASTVIRHKRHPYFCEVEDGYLLLYSLVDHRLVARIEPDDELIDISSLTLGYINLDDPKAAIYLMREPLRQYKQGVDLSRLSQYPLGIGPVHWKSLQSKALVRCVLNEYPALEEAIELITKQKYKSVAIDRDIALLRDEDTLKVYLKNLEVGTMKLGTNQVVVPMTSMSSFTVDVLQEIKGWEVVSSDI